MNAKWLALSKTRTPQQGLLTCPHYCDFTPPSLSVHLRFPANEVSWNFNLARIHGDQEQCCCPAFGSTATPPSQPTGLAQLMELNSCRL
jgi:hypothetical protein